MFDYIYNILKGIVDALANWLELIGFIFTIVTFIYVLLVDKKIKKLILCLNFFSESLISNFEN